MLRKRSFRHPTGHLCPLAIGQAHTCEKVVIHDVFLVHKICMDLKSVYCVHDMPVITWREVYYLVAKDALRLELGLRHLPGRAKRRRSDHFVFSWHVATIITSSSLLNWGCRAVPSSSRELFSDFFVPAFQKKTVSFFLRLKLTGWLSFSQSSSISSKSLSIHSCLSVTCKPP